MINLKNSTESSNDKIQDTITAVIWRDWRKPENIAVRTVSISASTSKYKLEALSFESAYSEVHYGLHTSVLWEEEVLVSCAAQDAAAQGLPICPAVPA